MVNHLFENDEDAITFDEQVFSNNDGFSLTGNISAATRDALAEIRREASDIYNRLHSIAEDTIFVEIVAKAYPHLPLLPNLRCGAWYTNPDISTAVPAYFKSTDGHFSNWSFNLRRPNLHLLPLIADRNGIVLVDSTRAGKKVPDALSKTVPIWCAVINRAIRIRYPEKKAIGWDDKLYTPPASVSAQEHSQIASRIDKWADELSNSSYNLPNLVHPLRPLWITPTTSNFPDIDNMAYLPIVCVSASKQISEGIERRSSGFSYIQGSADDHEAWGMGLTPDLFWRFHDKLLNTPRSRLPDLISTLVTTSAACLGRQATSISKAGGRLLLCANADIADQDFTCAHLIVTTSDAESTPLQPTLVLQTQAGRDQRVCISCDSGNDIAAGIALVALQLFFDENGVYCGEKKGSMINKQTLQTRLEWIISDRPEVNPSRSTLKRVNEFLLTPQRGPERVDAYNRVQVENYWAPGDFWFTSL
ncbi:initiator tRNA phosphoribosyl transferase-domain-containing protein [Mucidula mucida]|nr:initiator tRNA phosphoribosyl transferase-domain-containing protein [Mucidula mucida]